MTLLVSWAAIDNHGTSSVYMTSDSRISWGDNGNYDMGRKVFAFSKWPDIIGYSGDVLFPSIALGQIIEMADAGLLFRKNFTCEQRFNAVVHVLNYLWNNYPHSNPSISSDNLSIIHASRDMDNNEYFMCNKISWSKNRGWHSESSDIPKVSGKLFVLGSGASEFNARLMSYCDGPNKDTSRSIFHCFCDTLINTKLKTVGGVPQLVGIYRKPLSNALTFGVIHNGQRYYLGASIDNFNSLESVEWRNINFEICDASTMKIHHLAQPQPDPLRRL